MRIPFKRRVERIIAPAASARSTLAAGNARWLLIASLLLTLTFPQIAFAQNWDAIDRAVQSRVFRVNVAVRIKINGKLFAQLADLSPRKHYPVFATTTDDHGYRVVGYGTCFAAKAGFHDGTYFLTNKHVTDFGDGMIQECKRFFAAVHLHAEKTAGLSNPEERYHLLLQTINLALKKNLGGADRQIYQASVDQIWDDYDSTLSVQADPKRELFNKYAALAGVEGEAAFFLHPSGRSSRPPIPATLFKTARSNSDPDLSALLAKGVRISGLELSTTAPAVGDVVQAIGYPVIKQFGVMVPSVYQPTFTTGRVRQVSAELVRFAAPVSKGDSGGPLIDEHGRVVGVVERRALTNDGIDVAPATTGYEFASAVSAAAVRVFSPELFASTDIQPDKSAR